MVRRDRGEDDCDPVVTEAVMEYRGGCVEGLTVDLRFATDAAVQDTFMALAESTVGLHDDSGNPIYTTDRAAAWLATAEDFAGR